jgi:hypothetical protein
MNLSGVVRLGNGAANAPERIQSAQPGVQDAAVVEVSETRSKPLAGGSLSALSLNRNKILSALWAADVFKVNALHIGGRNRKSAECAGRIEGSMDFLQVNLLVVHLRPNL